MSNPEQSSMRTPVILTLLAGLCLTTAVCLYAMRTQAEQTHAIFQRDADKIADDTANRLKAHFDMLLSIRGLYASSESVERNEFASFIRELDLARRYPGFQTIEFVKALPEAELNRFTQAVRNDKSLTRQGYPGFTVHPEVTQDQHYVIEFCEPMVGNEAAFGFDLASSPLHRQALAVARDTNRIVATEPIRLLQEIGNQAGFVARAAIYRNGMPIETLAQRQAALFGFAAVVFRVDNLMQEVLDNQLLPHMTIRIVDAGYFRDAPPSPRQDKVLFDSERAYPNVEPSGAPLSELNTISTLNIGERRWEIQVTARDGRRYGSHPATIVMLAAGGILISILASALLAVFHRRRILAEQLRLALDEQRAFQDNAAVGIVLITDRIIRRSNRGIEEMVGAPPGGLIGVPSKQFFKTESDYNTAGEQAYAAINAGLRWQGEWPLLRGDGSTIWCVLNGKAVDANDLSKGAVWVIHDITDRKQAEAALVEAKNKLERSLAEVEQQKANVQAAHDDLSSVLDKLQQAQASLIFSEKMASLGSLVAGIAHELNTPIGNSLLAATALADRVAEFERLSASGTFKRSALSAHLEETRLACQLLAGSLHKAAHLIASFKQVAVDQTSDERRHFDLCSVLADTLATYTVQLRRKDCTSSLDAPAVLQMDSYPGSIGQVISNLIGNALLHAFEGRNGAAIAISAMAMDEHWVEIVFHDNGVGMPGEILHRVFDPFFTTKMGQGGSGLGMNIVYNIVTGMLGGRINIDSCPGEGSTIRIVIPKVAPQHERDEKTNLF